MIKRNESGYILVFTLSLITFLLFVSSYIFNTGFIFGRLAKTMADREKARELAFGGIQLAISQLAVKPGVQEKAPEQRPNNQQPPPQTKKNEQSGSEETELLKAILPLLNRPQKFVLKESVEGINARLNLVIGSEEGKININRLYDFDKHKFIGEGQPNNDAKLLFQELFKLIQEKTKGSDLFSEFEKFLKERKYPLNDVTELLTIKPFEIFKDDLYYNPIDAPASDKLFLTDIFTVSSSKKEIEPWLFSNSMASLLKLKIEKEKTPGEDILKTFKERADWKNEWNKSLKLLYGIDYSALPKTIATLLSPSFSPKMFWVLSQANVGAVTVTIWAFLERDKGTSKNAWPIVHIRKIYLI